MFGERPILGRESLTGDTDRDTALTAGRMAYLMRLASLLPSVRTAALDAGRRASGTSRRALGAAVHRWIRVHIRFETDEGLVERAFGLRDPHELLIAPWQLLRMPEPAGDCDDFTMLAGSMLLALGIPVEIVTIAADPSNPRRWSHVYLYVICEDGSRLALDASHAHEIGWEAPIAYRRAVWPILFGLPPAPARSAVGLNGLSGPYAQISSANPTWRSWPRTEIEDQVINGRRRGGLGDITIDSPDSTGTDASGSWWQSIIPSVVTTGESILKAQFGQPAPGTYVQTGPGGTTYYRPAAGSVGLPGSIQAAASSPTWWIVGGAVLLGAVVLLSGRK